jgi:hypothetical protein
MYPARAHALRAAGFCIGFQTCVATAIAQTPALDVTGTIAADDGTPIGAASISLSAQGRVRTATSDAGGRFAFPALASGTYAVHAAAPVTPRC